MHKSSLHNSTAELTIALACLSLETQQCHAAVARACFFAASSLLQFKLWTLETEDQYVTNGATSSTLWCARHARHAPSVLSYGLHRHSD